MADASEPPEPSMGRQGKVSSALCRLQLELRKARGNYSAMQKAREQLSTGILWLKSFVGCDGHTHPHVLSPCEL